MEELCVDSDRLLQFCRHQKANIVSKAPMNVGDTKGHQEQVQRRFCTLLPMRRVWRHPSEAISTSRFHWVHLLEDTEILVSVPRVSANNGASFSRKRDNDCYITDPQDD
jgi:hypothetical protein